ncbi:MAG: hypothetical protein U1F29_05310 [Planctomycetota bacterium]
MRARLFYVLSTVAVFGLFSYFITRPDEQMPRPEPGRMVDLSHPQVESETRLAAHGSVALERPIDPVRNPAVAALEAAARVLESERVFEQDDRTLESKYAGATRGQLLAAASLLEEKRDCERQRIAKEMLANDRLITTNLQRDESTVPTLKSGADGSPVSTVVQVFDVENGAPVMRSATISAAEYPDYRALELEVWWLHSKLLDEKESNREEGK